VARLHGLNANMVFLWRRDPRFCPGRDAASFLPVEVTAAEVLVPPEPIIPSSDGQIEIILASGHRLTLSGCFDAEAVLRLARGLSAGSLLSLLSRQSNRRCCPCIARAI